MGASGFSIHEYTVIHHVSKILAQGTGLIRKWGCVLEIVLDRFGFDYGEIWTVKTDRKNWRKEIGRGKKDKHTDIELYLYNELVERSSEKNGFSVFIRSKNKPVFLDTPDMRVMSRNEKVTGVSLPVYFKDDVVGLLYLRCDFLIWNEELCRALRVIKEIVCLISPGVDSRRHEWALKEKEKEYSGRCFRFETLVQDYEKKLIIESLKETRGNQSEAAKKLGTTKRVIQYRIHKLGIDYKRYGKPSPLRHSARLN